MEGGRQPVRVRDKGPIRDVLTRAAAEGAGETRIRAIEALRIFQDEECARFLESW